MPVCSGGGCLLVAGSDVRDNRSRQKTHPAFWRSSDLAMVLAILEEDENKSQIERFNLEMQRR